MRQKTLRALLGLGLIASVLLYLAVISGLLGITLPTPSGTYAVGRIDRDLVDRSRREIFGSDPNANREIVVTVY